MAEESILAKMNRSIKKAQFIMRKVKAGMTVEQAVAAYEAQS